MKQKDIQDHFDQIASSYDEYKRRNWYYYQRLKTLLQRLIPPGKRVLEVGCGTGDVLVALAPSFGVGIDVSKNMISLAQKKHTHKHIRFYPADIVSFTTTIKFDYIFMSDVIEHLSDVDRAFRAVKNCMGKKTTLLNVMSNPRWEGILMIGEKLGLKMPEGPHQRISYSQIQQITHGVGLEIVAHGYDTLCPIYIPILSAWIDRYISPRLTRYNIFEYFAARARSV